ncbi:MAG: hemolysin family protein [Myxococcaceae bacterium]
MSDLGFIVLALALVAANGFFVAVEFALVKVRPTQLRSLEEQGKAGASMTLKMRLRLDEYLSAAQVGVTLASLGLGWVGEPAFARLLEPLVRRLAPDSPNVDAVAHTAGFVVAFGIITVLHIVLGEMLPKTIAIQRPQGTSLALALPMRLFFFLAWPLIWLLNEGTRLVARLFGLKVGAEASDALGEDELRMVFASSAESGLIATERAALLERALGMLEKTARQVLVPRSQVQYLDLEESIEKNVTDARLAGYTWLPVCRGNLDRVEGVINVKDLFFLLSKGELKTLSQVQRPVLFVPENVTLEQLLSEFRRRKKQLAVVVDEHGGTSGIVTLADVVAELVGDVAEMGRKVEPVKTLPGGRLELPGTAQLDDLEHTLEVDFGVEENEVSTIGGYLMAKLGRVPVEGDEASVDEYRVYVVKMDGPRVVTVRIEPKAPTPPPPTVPPPAAGSSAAK